MLSMLADIQNKENAVHISRTLMLGAMLVAGALAGAGASVIAQDATHATQEAAETGQHMSQEEFDRVFDLGRANYSSSCSSCHGANGEGSLGPSLIGNEYLADTSIVTETIIRGFSYMPAFGDDLNDNQVAAISTYIRNAWGNEFGPVFPEDAAAARR